MVSIKSKKGWSKEISIYAALTFLLTFIAEFTDCRGTCRLGEFRCESGECIEKSKVCDSIRDCPSGIDEYVCTPKFRRGLCGHHRTRYRAQNGAIGELGQKIVSFLLGAGPKKGGIFQCQFGGCIPLQRLCDGNINCIGGSDESEICENNSCLPGQFRCKYGACIPDWQMCNGRVNCPDGSDETPESCKFITCKPTEFRCRYGGCIPKNRICDIKKHCADGSDEFDFLCLITRAKMVNQWGAEGKMINEEQDKRVLAEFERRKNKNSFTEKAFTFIETTTTLMPTPIPTTLNFSSTSSILNISTTTTTTPKSSTLPIDILSQDNTIQTNYDSSYTSTKSPKISTSFSVSISISNETAKTLVSKSSTFYPLTLTETPSSSTTNVPILVSTTEKELPKFTECTLPDIPENSEASITNCAMSPLAYFCRDSSKTVPPGVVLQYECEAGYLLFGPPAITCENDGRWSSKPPECDPNIDVRWGFGSALPNNFDLRCPSLVSPKGVIVECIDPKNLAVKSCSEKQSPEIEARFTCAPYYRSLSDLPAHYEKCDEKGKWIPGVHSQFNCVPDCGLSEVPKTAYIHNGQSTKRGQWPWHVAIFLRHKGELKYLCGGALTTEQTVLTSAHCVTLRGTQRDPSDFFIMLGKQHIEIPDSDPFVQKRLVSKIFVKDSFNYRSLDSDIAILALQDPAVLSFYVRPVCYPQTSNSFLEEYQLAPGSLGTVVGFGFTENGTLSQELRMAELPVVSATECANSQGDFFASMTRSTSYCAGYQNGTQVCNGDSGGGHYFRAMIRGTTRWYIQGLVSYGIPDPDKKTCASSQYAIFTRVGRYGDWIVRTLSRESLI